jgi:hypothetical protein
MGVAIRNIQQFADVIIILFLNLASLMMWDHPHLSFEFGGEKIITGVILAGGEKIRAAQLLGILERKLAVMMLASLVDRAVI